MTQTPTATRAMPRMIDVHGHPITALGFQGPMLVPPRWSVQEAIDLMDQHGIAATVLSQGNITNDGLVKDAANLSRRLNETMAEFVRAHPTRFGAMAAVPGHSPDATVEEMNYALDTLGLDGVGTSTSIGDVYLGDPKFDPWFEEMHRRGVTLFCHPTEPEASKAVDLGIHPSALEFMFDTTRMIASLIYSGAKTRFSGINIITTHGGGTLPFLAKRVALLAQVFGPGEGRPPITSAEVVAALKSFYYDLTAATSPAQLFGLQDMVPTSQIVMGFDYPYMPTVTMAPAIADVAAWQGFSDDDLQKIAFDNAARLFPKLAARIGGAS